MKSKDKEKSPIDIVNYRVFRHWEKDGREWYAIHHCYYSKENPEVPHSYSADPVRWAAGHTEKDLKGFFKEMEKAFDREVLEFECFDKRVKK